MTSAEGSRGGIWWEVVRWAILLAAGAVLGAFLASCAPVIQIQPCECPQREQVSPYYDWQLYLPTYPPQEVPGVPWVINPAGAVQDNYAERVFLLDAEL